MLPNLSLVSSILSEPIQSTLIHHGDDFTVVEVNSKWMFRFPRSQEAPAVLEIEKQFLNEFASISPIPVPLYQYVGPGFVGYPKIEGLLLSPSRYKALPRSSQKRIAVQIGDFLTSLHTFPIEHALQMGMSEGWNNWRQKAFQTFKSDIAPRLKQKTLKGSMACLEGFFSKNYIPAVIHGDFYPPDHLFLDPQRQELSGIIDFGDLTIEDPACDLKNILSELGEDALIEVLNSYGGQAGTEFIERMRLIIKAEPLFDAAYDVQFGYPGRLTHHIRDIETLFGN